MVYVGKSERRWLVTSAFVETALLWAAAVLALGFDVGLWIASGSRVSGLRHLPHRSHWLYDQGSPRGLTAPPPRRRSILLPVSESGCDSFC
jgi:hypothetical protein